MRTHSDRRAITSHSFVTSEGCTDSPDRSSFWCTDSPQRGPFWWIGGGGHALSGSVYVLDPGGFWSIGVFLEGVLRFRGELLGFRQAGGLGIAGGIKAAQHGPEAAGAFQSEKLGGFDLTEAGLFRENSGPVPRREDDVLLKPCRVRKENGLSGVEDMVHL